MLSLGKYTVGQQCNAVIFQKPSSKTVLFPARTHQTRLLTWLNPPRTLGHLGLFGVTGERRSGLCLFASHSQRKGSDSVLEVEDFDEDDEFFEEGEEGFTEEEDEDEDDEFIPMLEMKQWLKNKPRGFGEGKVYDTSIEDKLMDEIEQSRRAQLANINNLKKNHGRSISKRDQSQQEKG